jgi:hypothetical protein
LSQNGKPKSIAQDTARKPQSADVKALRSLALIIQFNIIKSVLDAKSLTQLPSQTKPIAIQLVAIFIDQCVNEKLKIEWVADYARHSDIRSTSEIKVFASCVTNTFI